MKKIKLFSIIFFVIAFAIHGVYVLKEMIDQDNEAPMIQCESEELTVSVSITEEELLQDVTAQDNKSGDVSDTLVIEKITELTEEQTRVITYAAIDDAGNIGHMQRVLKYEDYQEPRFSLSDPLRFPMGSSVDLLGRVHASSVLDGDLSDKIKYTMEGVIDLQNPGTYLVEYRVMDSAGRTVKIPLEVEIYNQIEERIKVVLKDYLVYVQKGKKFKPESYFVGSDIEGVLSVQSNVDTSVPGIYEVEYQVEGLTSIGKSRLIVVVVES